MAGAPFGRSGRLYAQIQIGVRRNSSAAIKGIPKQIQLFDQQRICTPVQMLYVSSVLVVLLTCKSVLASASCKIQRDKRCVSNVWSDRGT